MSLPAGCDPQEGCGTLRETRMQVKEHERRLDGVDVEIKALHKRITDEIKEKVGEAKQYAQDNKVWILLLINILLMIIFKFWK
jgi:hypothetical protein